MCRNKWQQCTKKLLPSLLNIMISILKAILPHLIKFKNAKYDTVTRQNYFKGTPFVPHFVQQPEGHVT